MLQKEKNIFFQTLSGMYPENRTDLIWETPRQLLIAIVMSAQTTDKQVNKVTANFFSTIKTPYDTLRLTQEQRADQYIVSVNYAASKAKNLYKTAQILVDYENNHPDHIPKWTYIPDTLVELIKLHGVGEKTAKVLLHILYGTNDIAVDTHVHRVSNRIWLVKTQTPLQTSKLIDKAIPDKYKSIAHHTLIFFGRYHCTARKPKCKQCPFTSFCRYFKQQHTSSKTIPTT